MYFISYTSENNWWREVITNHNSGVLSEIWILYCAWRILEGGNRQWLLPQGRTFGLRKFFVLVFSKGYYVGYFDHCWKKKTKQRHVNKKKNLIKHSLGKSKFRDLLLCTVWVDQSSWQRRKASGAWGRWSHCVHSWGAVREGSWFLSSYFLFI